MKEKDIRIALIDDHQLMRAGLARVIEKFDGYKVVSESDNGKDFIDQLSKENLPEIVLLDISMPVMDGFQTAAWIKINIPPAKILVLSMIDNEIAVIRMINLGARGYILKDSKPAELKKAFDHIVFKGYYSNELVDSSMLHNLDPEKSHPAVLSIGLSKKEEEFLQYACTEMTYKEIADKMEMSPRTIDNYRDSLFEKFDIKSRIGLVLLAIKTGFYHI